ncbi:MAG TPA: flagellar motor protein MotD, partial [Gammaproteobacteria bacterium]|nr:flagellar motor protein MotD [Gammaproteobacteria bacterium]
RAASVVRLFADAGIDPSRVGAVGFGAYRPSVINFTEADRQKNRRVIIRMLSGEDMFGTTSPYAPKPAVTVPSANLSDTNSPVSEPARATP